MASSVVKGIVPSWDSLSPVGSEPYGSRARRKYPSENGSSVNSIIKTNLPITADLHCRKKDAVWFSVSNILIKVTFALNKESTEFELFQQADRFCHLDPAVKAPKVIQGELLNGDTTNAFEPGTNFGRVGLVLLGFLDRIRLPNSDNNLVNRAILDWTSCSTTWRMLLHYYHFLLLVLEQLVRRGYKGTISFIERYLFFAVGVGFIIHEDGSLKGWAAVEMRCIMTDMTAPEFQSQKPPRAQIRFECNGVDLGAGSFLGVTIHLYLLWYTPLMMTPDNPVHRADYPAYDFRLIQP
eukprot:scaffold674_cov126-Cylindrotheca_fusiformis.AAC.24